MDTFGGAQVLEKAMNSKGFGAFRPPRGILLGSFLGSPDSGILEELNNAVKAK